MKLSSLHMRDFRSFQEAELSFDAQTTILIGENGIGKTNILDAIYLSAMGVPLRSVERNQELIAHDSTEAYLRAHFASAFDQIDVQLHLSPNGRRTLVNGKSSTDKEIGQERSALVAFVPEDRFLVKGSPQYRRDALDRAVYVVQPSYVKTVRAYKRLLKQRNSMLASDFCDKAMLLAFQSQWMAYAIEIWRARLQELKDLYIIFQANLEAIMGQHHSSSIQYHFGLESAFLEINLCDLNIEDQLAALQQNFETQLSTSFSRERAAGRTLLGPHRDDWQFIFAAQSARAFASQGQTRAIVLALKLAMLQRVAQKRKTQPILLLDDVAGELDQKRIALLMQCVAETQAQTIVTVTHLEALQQTIHGQVISVADLYISKLSH